MLNKKSKLSILSKNLMTIFALGGAVVVNSSCFAASVFGLNTVSMSEGETVFENKSAEKGGAIYNDSVNKSINNVRFDKNEATKGNGGAILNVASTLELSGQVTFNANKALNGNGGAIANDANSKTIIKGDSTFTKNNSATFGGAIFNEGYFSLSGTQDFNGNSGAYGGAIINYISGSNLQIEGVTTFTDNKASHMGGGIYNQFGSVGISGKTTFNTNSAANGGAIDNGTEGTVKVSGRTEFNKNNATANGGAIYNQDGLVDISGNVRFEGNTASVYGGAIAHFQISPNVASKVVIKEDSVFANNSAKHGGAISNSIGTLNISGSASFQGNKASNNGGAIYNQGGILQIEGATLFENNTASNNGGALASYQNSKVIFGSGNHIFRGNSSDTNGGAIYNTGNVTFGGNNVFELNTANGEANDIFNNGRIEFGGEGNLHIVTILNGGVTGAGTMNLNSGRLVLGSGAQIHQKSFTAKAGTMTTVVLSDAHHVHDKNVAHFDELTDENGTGHDKVATAVINNGFGIHTTGQMTLEKGAVLNIVSDDIQAGHTYLVAYNEEAPKQQVAKMARTADTSQVIKPAGFEHDETSWKNENLISTDPLKKWERVEGDNTNGYILVTSKNSNSVSIIEDLAGLDQVYFSWLSDLEDLRQRLGEVRLGADNGIWTKVSYSRYRASGLGDGKVKSTDYSIHVGADGTLYKNNGHKFFAGFSFKGGHTDMKAARAAGTGDLNHYTWKLYGTYVHEKGSYADIVASVGTFNNRFRGYHDSWTGQVHGDVNNWGAGISGEVGHQFRFLEESAGSFWFAEPQIQLSYFRVKGKNYETSNAIHVEQKSVDFLTGRVGVSAGKQFAYGADKKRYLQLSAKAGLIHEFAGDQKLRLNEKKLSADGKKNLFYYGADMDWQFADNHKLYLKVDRATGSGYRKDIQIQGGYRYSF